MCCSFFFSASAHDFYFHFNAKMIKVSLAPISRAKRTQRAFIMMIPKKKRAGANVNRRKKSEKGFAVNKNFHSSLAALFIRPGSQFM